MSVATLTSKGQITVPKDIRDRLGLRTGDRIAFRPRDDGSIVVEPETVDLLSLAGSLKSTVKGVSVERMGEVVAEAAVASVGRTRAGRKPVRRRTSR